MPSKKPRATEAEVQTRVNTVLGMVLSGLSVGDMLQFASEQTPPWEIGERQMRNYITKADELLAERLEKDRRKQFNRAVAQRDALFARCMTINDYSNARAVLKDKAELLGLYPSPADELAREFEGLKQAFAELERKTNAGNSGNAQEGDGAVPGADRAPPDAGEGTARTAS